MSLLLLMTNTLTTATPTPPPTQPCPFPIITSTTTASITATPGQTLTIYPIPPPMTATTTAVTWTQNDLSGTFPTITATEIDILLLRSPPSTLAGSENEAGARAASGVGDVWTTLVYLTTPLPEATPVPPTNKYIIVPPYPAAGGTNANSDADASTGAGGWNSWSSAQQGGLVAGVVIAGMILVGLFWWACLRSRIWVARDVAYGADLRGSNNYNRKKGTGKGWVYDLAGRR